MRKTLVREICRSESDYALAARMLLKLRQGSDVRAQRIEAAKHDLQLGRIDLKEKLNRALDIVMDELEAELEASADQSEMDDAGGLIAGNAGMTPL